MPRTLALVVAVLAPAALAVEQCAPMTSSLLTASRIGVGPSTIAKIPVITTTAFSFLQPALGRIDAGCALFAKSYIANGYTDLCMYLPTGVCTLAFLARLSRVPPESMRSFLAFLGSTSPPMRCAALLPSACFVGCRRARDRSARLERPAVPSDGRQLVPVRRRPPVLRAKLHADQHLGQPHLRRHDTRHHAARGARLHRCICRRSVQEPPHHRRKLRQRGRSVPAARIRRQHIAARSEEHPVVLFPGGVTCRCGGDAGLLGAHIRCRCACRVDGGLRRQVLPARVRQRLRGVAQGHKHQRRFIRHLRPE